ncbi:MAG: ferrous iron transport protein A [Clostridia bacterium]|nr:ferrous iron transport protein A [Clostridia bacterium]
MMLLSQGKKNRKYTICGFDSAVDGVLRRFLELGFTKGEKVEIVSTSLSKKVFLVKIRGYLLSVRASLLNKVQVKDD